MSLPFLNPYGRAIKKYLIDSIPDQYTEEINDTAERVAHNIATKKDAENFLKLLAAMYQGGYNKAMESANKAIENHGMKIKIVPPSKQSF